MMKLLAFLFFALSFNVCNAQTAEESKKDIKPCSSVVGSKQNYVCSNTATTAPSTKQGNNEPQVEPKKPWGLLVVILLWMFGTAGIACQGRPNYSGNRFPPNDN